MGPSLDRRVTEHSSIYELDDERALVVVQEPFRIALSLANLGVSPVLAIVCPSARIPQVEL